MRSRADARQRPFVGFPRGHAAKPLDLLTANRNERRSTKRARFHCVQTALPDGALVLVDKAVLPDGTSLHIALSSPEFCFLQMARLFPWFDLIALGFELCGDYALAPNAPRGFLPRSPISTPGRSWSLSRQAPITSRGPRRARKGGSANPARVALAQGNESLHARPSSPAPGRNGMQDPSARPGNRGARSRRSHSWARAPSNLTSIGPNIVWSSNTATARGHRHRSA